MERSEQVVVAGAGIAGLTLALTLAEIGVPVTIYEQATRLPSTGLGINLQPHAVRELTDLGLGDELDRVAIPTEEFALVGRDGEPVWHEARGTAAGFAWPQWSLRRGDLHRVLRDAVVDRLGPDAVVTDREVLGYEHRAGGVDVELAADRSSAAVLVGADGLHSKVRARMFPGEGGPRWGGGVLWRGIAEAPTVRSGRTFVVVGGVTRRFMAFPLSEPTADGRQVYNWLAELEFDDRRGWRRGDWNTRVAADEFVESFADWTFDWLDVPALIGRTDAIYEWPMVDRDPVDHWVHGSVVLIGDAAHPMYPLGSNGATQAILDARVLGAAMLEHGPGRDALAAFQSAVLGERNELARRARNAGPMTVLGNVTSRRPVVYGDADVELASSDEVERFVTEFRAATRHAVEALNAAPPTVRTDG